MKVQHFLRSTQEVQGTIDNAGAMCTLDGALRYLQAMIKPMKVTKISSDRLAILHRRTQRIYATIQA